MAGIAIDLNASTTQSPTPMTATPLPILVRNDDGPITAIVPERLEIVEELASSAGRKTDGEMAAEDGDC
jgi:hypothetical protein